MTKETTMAEDNELKDRVGQLEEQVQMLMRRFFAPEEGKNGHKDWRKSVGMFRDRAVIKEIDAEGERIRQEDREQSIHDYS